MPRGPAPSPNARRRNNPTVPTRELPSGGRGAPAPQCPYALGERGAAWWAWAWALPQATAWDAGSLYVVARRATLEDDLEVLENVGEFADVIGLDDDEAARQLDWMFGRLKGIASGRSVVMKEMRELDNRLGLNPKAMLDLRWSIRDDAKVVGLSKPEAKRSLRAVEAAS